MVVECAMGYVGEVEYRHHHDPDWVDSRGRQGIDCSNFTRWVFKEALGDAFDFRTSNIHQQSRMRNVTMVDDRFETQRFLRNPKSVRDGDLVFFTNADGDHISHVGIYAKKYHGHPDYAGQPIIIHSTATAAARRAGYESGVVVTPFTEREMRSWPLRCGPEALGGEGGHILRHPGLRDHAPKFVAEQVELFRAIDRNSDGNLSKRELTSFLQELDGDVFTRKRCGRIFDIIDYDESNSISFLEFIEWAFGDDDDDDDEEDEDLSRQEMRDMKLFQSAVSHARY